MIVSAAQQNALERLMRVLGIVAGPPLPPKPEPSSDVYARLVAVEEAMRAAFADRERQAQMIATLVTRADRLEDERDQARDDVRLLSKDLSELRGRFAQQSLEHERSREAQGKRIGELERQVRLIPILREYSAKARLMADAWRLDALDIRERLIAAGGTPPPEPKLPELPSLDMPEVIDVGS